MIEIISKSSSQTKKAAKELAFSIKETKGRKTALVLALEGNLGSGKTTFVQGLAKGLGIKNKILSPTFVVMKRFPLNNLTPKESDLMSDPTGQAIKQRKVAWRPRCFTQFNNLYHIDCYRIEGKDLLKLGLKDIMSEPQNLVVIEWAEKIKKILPKGALWIKFKHLNEKSRKIKFCFN